MLNKSINACVLTSSFDVLFGKRVQICFVFESICSNSCRKEPLKILLNGTSIQLWLTSPITMTLFKWNLCTCMLLWTMMYVLIRLWLIQATVRWKKEKKARHDIQPWGTPTTREYQMTWDYLSTCTGLFSPFPLGFIVAILRDRSYVWWWNTVHTVSTVSVGRNNLPYTFCAQIDFFCIFGTLRVQAVPKWRGYNFHAPGSPPKLHNFKTAAKILSSPISLLIEVRFEWFKVWFWGYGTLGVC